MEEEGLKRNTMAKKEHKCKTNEHIASLAMKYDFFDWDTLWDHNKKGLGRKNPTVLYKKAWFGGDIVKVPEKKEKKEACPVDQVHTFQVPTYKIWLRLRILNESFATIKDTDYELEVEDVDEPFEGKTKDGLIEHEIPANATTAILSLRVKAQDSDPPKKDADAEAEDDSKSIRGDVPITWKLKIGNLNPINEKAPNNDCISGLQQRFNNLALNSGPVDGILGPNTKAAVSAFCNIYQLTSTKGKGNPDRDVLSKLAAVHDGPGTIPKIPEPKEN